MNSVRHGALPVLLIATMAGVQAGFAKGPADPGQTEFDAGHFQQARALWESAAAAGDATAQFDVGMLYDLGDGVPEDAAKAYEWYRRAAESGSSAAQFNVGVMTDSGRGVPRDRAEAALWYGRAAAHGSARAGFNLGELYAIGDGVPLNPRVAEAWFRAEATRIPSAASHWRALRTAPPDETMAGNVVAPQPVYPGDLEPVGLPRTNSPAIALVWHAPPEPVPVRFLVEMRADRSSSKDLYSRYTDVTALLVPLAATPRSYEWRVSAVSAKQSQASGWQRFSVEPPPPGPHPAIAGNARSIRRPSPQS